MLTKRNLDALIFIDGYIRKNDGVSPTMDEIAAGMGLSCRAKAHYHLVALEERGFIRRIPNRARAIQVLQAVPGGKEPPKSDGRIPIYRSGDHRIMGYLPK